MSEYIRIKSFGLFLESSSFNTLNKWFTGSKIVDKNNKPMICYHGTSDNNIKEFDLNKVGSNTGNYGHYGYGIYFSTDVREARVYGECIYSCYLNIKNPFTGTDSQILELKNSGINGIEDEVLMSIDFESFVSCFKDKDIIAFLLNYKKYGIENAWDVAFLTDVDKDKLQIISNIVEYTTLNQDVYGVPDYIIDDLRELNIYPKINKGFLYSQSLHWITDLGKRAKEVTEVIKKLGYDGVWYGSEIVVFYPNQIKSINNDGSYDSNDLNIFS